MVSKANIPYPNYERYVAQADLPDGIKLDADEALRVAIESHLGIFGTLSDEEWLSAQQQMIPMLRALETYLRREQRYKEGWRSRGWLGNMADILRKAGRLRSMYWDGLYLWNEDEEPDLDDAYDLLNYICFFIRNAKENNSRGSGV